MRSLRPCLFRPLNTRPPLGDQVKKHRDSLAGHHFCSLCVSRVSSSGSRANLVPALRQIGQRVIACAISFGHDGIGSRVNPDCDHGRINRVSAVRVLNSSCDAAHLRPGKLEVLGRWSWIIIQSYRNAERRAVLVTRLKGNRFVGAVRRDHYGRSSPKSPSSSKT